MRSDALNWHNYGAYMEMTALSSNVYPTYKDESKRIIMHEGLSRSCCTNEGKSKRIIVNENLFYNYSADVDELCSTEKDKSENIIMEQNKREYK